MPSCNSKPPQHTPQPGDVRFALENREVLILLYHATQQEATLDKASVRYVYKVGLVFLYFPRHRPCVLYRQLYDLTSVFSHVPEQASSNHENLLTLNDFPLHKIEDEYK